ncbi:Hypothetical protein NATL1_00421 [Prochlorococcus marinus str. NATL1A]|uniref:Uncharacterized protein n=1 Tax=Prochlorococcus marinus (strain NATL1A) TaxID=167555 RepID=A2BZE6_PROM1|nr:sulfotransferase family protein [Prochlorococcus marinus]ABM74606.1 Hypothetical protein NATL1_00421 [Prochlorococcus marinus str. NATL1A]
MKGFGEQHKSKKKRNETTTFQVPFPFPLRESQENINIITNTPSKLSKEQIINQALKFHSKGNISEATKYYQYFINQGFKDHRVFSNYGAILRKQGKVKESGFFMRKAIEIQPNIPIINFNMGNILKDLGKLKEAEIFIRKSIRMDPNLTKAYLSLSTITYSNIDNKTWQDNLFSDFILKYKSQVEQVEIYFARANILHKEKKYKKSYQNLKLANNLQLAIKASDINKRIKKSQLLLIESDKKVVNKKEKINYAQSIFILGLPRCGSTLLESILSMNKDVYDLGEINILEESFIEYKKFIQDISLAELYNDKVKNKTDLNITTNKWLYNYQYAGIIARHIPNAKLIHCFRHPLDNILSLYRTHFASGNEYSSSLVDCARVYLDQEKVMKEYKNRYRSKIYDLNYDSLVNDPNKEIRSLISWLGWEWQDSFLSPQLNSRSVSTASNVQVRSPINSKSIGGWKNYKDMLKPAIEILAKTNGYKNIAS